MVDAPPFIYARDYVSTAQIAALAYSVNENLFRRNMTGAVLAESIRNSGASVAFTEQEIVDFSNNYEIIDYIITPQNQTGPDVIVLKNLQNGAIQFSVSGVNGGSELSNTVTYTNGVGFNDNIYPSVRDLFLATARSNPGVNIDLIGHSLGGQIVQVLVGEASLQGLLSQIETVTTFGTYGVNFSAAGNLLIDSKTVPNFRQIIAELDRVEDQVSIVHLVNDDDLIPGLFSPTFGARRANSINTRILQDGFNLVDLDLLGDIFLVPHSIYNYVRSLRFQVNNETPQFTDVRLRDDVISALSVQSGENPDSIEEIVVTARRISSDEVTVTFSEQSRPGIAQIDPVSGAALPSRLRRIPSVLGVGLLAPDGTLLVDARGRIAELDISYVDGVPTVVRSRVGDGVVDGRFGVSVQTTYSNGKPVSTEIRANGNPLPVDFSDAGSIIGQQLGRYLTGGNELTGIVSSAALQTIGNNIGDALDGFVGRQSINRAIDDATQTFGAELQASLNNAGIGAISSFLTAELINAIGVGGFAGELFNTVGGAYLAQVIGNLGGTNPFAGINEIATIGNAVGSFLGVKLASEIISFDTVGGQIGSAIGSSLGVIGAANIGLGQAIGLGSVLGGPVGAAIGAFVGFIGGGLVGSLFGGTPRSSADVVWNEGTDAFAAANGYARKGGSREAAESMAGAVADTLNGVLAATGGKLTDPLAVQVGSYGMWKKDYVYRPYASRDENTITRRFGGKDGAANLINYGLSIALTDADFRIEGGDIYAKRALYNGVALAAAGSGVEPANVLGDLAIAERYATYLASSASINALIAGEPDSVFAAEWAITFARAVELGLTRRHESDWYGGYGLLLEEAQANASDVAFGFDYDPISDRVSRITGVGDFVLGDAIDVAGQTNVAGTAAAETIDLRSNTYASEAIDVAAIVDAGEGDDIVHASERGDNVFAGTGNDTVFGGKLDDWVLGGDGNDTLDVGGEAAGTLGGDGNYLDGGAGDDVLRGREGAAWLIGGDGADTLTGGEGDDVLEGGIGVDTVDGGTGNDIYIWARGDGADRLVDGGAMPVAGASVTDYWTAQAGLALSSRGFGATPLEASGEDTLELREGLTLADLVIKRSMLAGGAPGNDLLIDVLDANRLPTGERLTLADWFLPEGRIEWLKLADGTAIRIGDFQSFIAGGSGNDVLIGTEGRDFAYGGEGDDLIRLLSGDDVGNGGPGRDELYGDDGVDLLVGGPDGDLMQGGRGDDFVGGDQGADQIYGADGNDLLSGGAGDGDFVAGGAGNDIFKYARGDGRDTIIDGFSNDWRNVWIAGTFQAGAIYDAATRTVTLDGTVIFDGAGWVNGFYEYDYEAKTLRRHAAPPGAVMSSDLGDDTIEFDAGIGAGDLRFERLGNDLVIDVGAAQQTGGFGTSGDVITLKNWYALAAGGDVPIEQFVLGDIGQIALSGWSLIAGTAGDDALDGGAGSDWLTGGSGNDSISGNDGADLVVGHDGNDALSGNAGDDVLLGGAGDDRLEGGDGADRIEGGDGLDIAAHALAAGVSASLVRPDFNTGAALGDVYLGIEGLADSAGNDYLFGNTGANVFESDTASDLLYGGHGEDVYRIGRSIASVTIFEGGFEQTSATTATGSADDGALDIVELAEGLSLADVAFAYSGNDLLLNWGSSQVTIVGQTAGSGAVEVIQFADGLAFDLAQWTTVATANGDVLLGGAAADALGGGDGNDIVSGAIGDDVLEGGNGDDILEGGDGADRLDGGSDTVSLGAVLAGGAEYGDTARYVGSLEGVAIDLVAGTATGGQAAGDVLIGIENLLGSWNASDVLGGNELANRLAGFGGNDTLEGRGGDDVLDGGDGADTLDGGDGADALNGGIGDDIATGGAGDDILAMGDGNDQANGGDGNDQIAGDAGDDRLFGDAGDDVIMGAAGSDTLDGGLGNDNLSGGAGNDMLSGGGGDDVYLFEAGDGADVIADSEGQNRIALADYRSDQIWLARDGDDLVVTFTGSTDSVRVQKLFAAGAADRSAIRAIDAADGSLYFGTAMQFLDGADGAAAKLIALMGTGTADLALLANARAAAWAPGGNAAPVGTVAALAMAERSEPVGPESERTAVGAAPILDADENMVAFALVQGPANGTVAIDATTGNWTYTPNVYFHGADSFVIQGRDANGQAANGQVNLTVTPENSRPTGISLFEPAPFVVERDRSSIVDRPAVRIGTIAVADPDSVDVGNPFGQHSYAVSDDRFEVVDGFLWLKANASLNFEAEETVSVIVTATDALGAGFAVSQPFVVTIGDDWDYQFGTDGDDTLVGDPSRGGLGGRDRLYGNAGNDTLLGGDADDELFGGDGDDSLFGEDGNDVLYAEAGAASTLSGGNGNDQLVGGLGADRLFGDAGDDVLAGGDGRDTLVGGAGTDVLDGGSDVDMADYSVQRAADYPGLTGADLGGGLIADYVAPDAAGVEVYLDGSGVNAGYAAGDTLIGIEHVKGTSGLDLLVGDAGANTLEGAGGADTLYGRDGADYLLGDGGNDILYGEGGDDWLIGGEGVDTLHGGAGNDRLEGTDGDVLNGDEGDDELTGSDGAETLLGGVGNDRLEGRGGNDVLDGGLGNDTYIMDRASGQDVIQNYDPFGTDIDVLGYRGVSNNNLWFMRDGNDLIVNVVGTSTSTRIARWFEITPIQGQQNHRIDFIVAGEQFTREVNIDGLLQLMAPHAAPTTQEAFDALLADTQFNATWRSHWAKNQGPSIQPIAGQAIGEDGVVSLAFAATDQFGLGEDAPPTSVRIEIEFRIPGTATQLSGLFDPASVIIGQPDANGVRSLQFTPYANVAGVADVAVRAIDAGGLATETVFRVDVNPVADAVGMSIVQQGNPAIDTFDGGAAIALTLQAAINDVDGSERIRLFRISGVPDGVSLNAGSVDAGGYWHIEASRIEGTNTFHVPGLAIVGPDGWAQDFSLTIEAESYDTSHGVESSVYGPASTLQITVNSRPTDIVFASGGAVDESSAFGTLVGVLAGVDADNTGMAYELLENPDGRYALNGTTGELTVATTSAFLFEYENYGDNVTPHTIRVRATDSSGLAIEKNLVVGIRDVNEQPGFPESDYYWTVQEGGAGQVVGYLSGFDPDNPALPNGTKLYYFAVAEGGTVAAGRNGEFRYSTVSQDGRFQIDPASGTVTSLVGFDYEVTPSAGIYTMLVRDGTDAPSYGLTNMHVSVANSNEPAIIDGGAAFSVSVFENNAPFQATGLRLTFTDPDGAGSTAAWSGGNAYFTVAADGSVVHTGEQINYEALPENLRTQQFAAVLNDGGVISSALVTVSVNNINEAPVFDTAYGYNQPGYVAIQQGSEILLAQFRAFDGDGDALTVTSSWSGTGFPPPVTQGGDGTFLFYHRPYNGETIIGDLTLTVSDGVNSVSQTVSVDGNFYYQGGQIPPVVLDLDGDGIELVSVEESQTRIDFDGDGIGDQTGWVGSDDGILALDLNRNGAIDSQSEFMFGSHTLDGVISDLEALARFDDNKNGWIDPGDSFFDTFKVWQDRNSDGVSDAGEVTSLAEREIWGVSIEGKRTSESLEGATDNVLYATSEYLTTKGRSHLVGDVMLAYKPSSEEGLAGRGVSPVRLTAPGDGARYAPLGQGNPLSPVSDAPPPQQSMAPADTLARAPSQRAVNTPVQGQIASSADLAPNDGEIAVVPVARPIELAQATESKFRPDMLRSLVPYSETSDTPAGPAIAANGFAPLSYDPLAQALSALESTADYRDPFAYYDNGTDRRTMIGTDASNGSAPLGDSSLQNLLAQMAAFQSGQDLAPADARGIRPMQVDSALQLGASA